MNFVFGQVHISAYIEMSFPGNVWYNLDTEFYWTSPVKSSRCDSCFNLDKGRFGDPLFYSALDSNVFYITTTYHLQRTDKLEFTFWVLSSATHSFGEVLRDELSRFQECAYITLSKERFDEMMDSVISIVDSVLEENPGGFFYEHNCYGNEDLGPCTRGFSEPPVRDMYVHDSLDVQIERQNAALSAIPNRPRVHNENRWLYRAFDLNGRFYPKKDNYLWSPVKYYLK
jgi:hypothetical protein